VKTTIIALSAAALIAAAPTVVAQAATSKMPGLQHQVSRQHHPAVSSYAPRHEMQSRSSRKGYLGAFGYVPADPRGLDRDLETSRQAGGGGGGGGGGM
jgi:hypothetical protein